jgi:hypothetical protein
MQFDLTRHQVIRKHASIFFSLDCHFTSSNGEILRHKQKNGRALGIKTQPIADYSEQTMSSSKVGHSKSKTSSREDMGRF